MMFVRSTMILFIFGVCLFSVALIDAYPSAEQVQPCLNYCSNDALCLLENNQPRCYCLPEWEGERCQLTRKPSHILPIAQEDLRRMNARNTPCSYLPELCKNGGVCFVNDQNKLACQCPYPFDGTRCQEYSVCYNYCFNGGVCTETGTADAKEPSCECDAGFGGTRCQIVETTTAPPTTTTTTGSTTTDIICTFLPDGYCNTGSCIVVNNRAMCQCPPTHTGDQCQTPLGATQPPIQTIPPIIPGQTIPPIIPGQTIPPVIPGQSTFPPATITCAQSPCRNSRPCYNNGNTYYCYCGAQYTGVNCESLLG